MTLLFVEDDKIIRDNFRTYLNSIFSVVYEVSDGKDAFPEYERIKPDVILLDINLPSIDGISIAKRIRSTNDKVSIIILSAIDDKKILIEAAELRLTKYLLKPINRKQLQEAITKVTKEVRDKRRQEDLIFLKDNYYWSKKEKKLFKNDKNITLTKNEIILLESFCLQSNPIATNEEIYYKVYNDTTFNENKVRMLIKRFRIKTYQDILINIYALGFKFNII